MAQSSFGIDPTRVDTAQQYPLGWEIGDPRAQDFPINVIRYVKAGSNIAINQALKVKADEATLEPNVLIPTSAAKQAVVAIAHVAIGSGSFGWVTVKGRVPGVTVGGSVTAEQPLKSSSSAGKLIAMTQADSNFTSNIYDEMVAAAAGVGVIALDSGDSNAPIEVLLT